LARGISAHLGLNAVDPEHYAGWSGPLSACEADAHDMAAIARAAGFESTVILTADATRAALQRVFDLATSRLRSGEVFLLTFSGHGGQLPDLSGEEEDTLDDTSCLRDGMWVDNETAANVRRFRSGVRAVFVNDSCHSGTALRLARRRDRAETYRAMPPEVARQTYLAHRAFYDRLQERARTADMRSAGASTLLLAACEEDQLAADGPFNGRFTAALKATWDNGRFRGTYESFHRRIRARLPSDQVPTLVIDGPEAAVLVKERPFSIDRSTTMQTTATPAGGLGISLWTKPTPRDSAARAGGNAATPLTDGTYVTPAGRANLLYVVEDGERRPVGPEDVEARGVTQQMIRVLEPEALASVPLQERARSRAVGRDLQTYLWSDLRSGHFMQSWVWLQGTTLTVTTVTETVTWFGGYTGGVSVVLFDGAGQRIQHDDFRTRYGVDGRFFGSGRREDTETYGVPQDVADRAETILIAHYWDPKVDLVRVAIDIGFILWEVIRLILENRDNGEAVNAGGETF
jgi:hypothetical protein